MWILPGPPEDGDGACRSSPRRPDVGDLGEHDPSSKPVVEVFTSRWQNRKLADLACVPVGTSRGTPRFAVGYRYRMMRELAPSRSAFALEGPQEFEGAHTLRA